VIGFREAVRKHQMLILLRTPWDPQDDPSKTGQLRHPADISKPLREAAKEKANKYQHTYADNHSIPFLPAIFSTSGRKSVIVIFGLWLKRGASITSAWLSKDAKCRSMGEYVELCSRGWSCAQDRQKNLPRRGLKRSQEICLCHLCLATEDRQTCGVSVFISCVIYAVWLCCVVCIWHELL
jgi:hypothetical protein